jgi:hypothetical protein
MSIFKIPNRLRSQQSLGLQCSSNPNTHPLDPDRTPVLRRPDATLDGRLPDSQVLTDRQCNCENGLVAYGTATES